jgi:hypothetical protein
MKGFFGKASPRVRPGTCKTVLYPLIIIIILISYIIIKLSIKMRTIPAKTGNITPFGTLPVQHYDEVIRNSLDTY